MSNLALNTSTPYESSGGRLVTADGRALPLKSASLEADAKGGVARAVLRQRFTNPYSEPLAVTYLMPLPADGAVSGYAFTVGERRIVGEVDRKAAARERFERAIVEGRTAALVDQERSSLFTQEIGNIPPGAELVAELSIDQKLAWLPDGAWEWRFPTVVAPRYLGEPGRVADAQRVTVDVADRPLPVQLDMSLTIRDALLPGKSPESPSHPIRSVEDAGRFAVSLAEDRGAALDRDVVVRWPAAQREVGLSLDVHRRKDAGSAAYGLLTIVPPTPDSQPKAIARDLIVLLDTSGSMSGEPLSQARRVVSALVDSLIDEDKLEMIEFSSAPRRWKSRAVNATSSNRAEAQRWLAKLQASGGTEMRSGILEAFAPLREDSQRQIVLVTDGLIGSEQEVISAICDELPAPSRVHVVGVGSSVNRSLTGPAARAGRGAELVIGIGEDAERAAKRLVARTCAPLITELSVSGSAVARCAPERLPDLFAGSPALLSLELKDGGGEIVVRGRTAEGTYESRLRVPAVDPGMGNAAVAALFGREAVEDLEMRIAAGTPRAELDPKIEQLGLQFQISTRLTSWIAVSDKAMVDPTAPTRSEKVPQMLPHGMPIEGLGLRAASPGFAHARAPMAAGLTGMSMPSPAPASAARPPPPPQQSAKGGGIADGLFDAFGGLADKAKEVFRGRAKTEAYEGEAADEEAAASSASPEPEAPAFEQQAEKKADAPKPAAGKKRAQLEEGGPRRLAGRVRLSKDRELVIELTVDAAGLEWDPANRATLRLADGTVVTVDVDLAHSTRPMSAGAGLVLRVTLQLAQPLQGTPALLELTNRGELLTVSL